MDYVFQALKAITIQIGKAKMGFAFQALQGIITKGNTVASTAIASTFIVCAFMQWPVPPKTRLEWIVDTFVGVLCHTVVNVDALCKAARPSPWDLFWLPIGTFGILCTALYHYSTSTLMDEQRDRHTLY
jgi:hypothetical protein